jgi:hypothetical protein
MNESIYRRPCKDGDEVDAFSHKSRRMLAWRTGEVSAIKTRYNRRVRRETRQGLRSGRI